MADSDDFPLPTQPWGDLGEAPTIPGPDRGWNAPATSTDGVSTGGGRGWGGWIPPMPAHLQASFPQYEIRSILGRGGMGAVYQAWQKSLHRLVAVKVLPPGLRETNENFAERFQREAQAMARFSHPGIVAVFDAGQTPEGLFYFVMEYIEGTDLQRLLQERGPLPGDLALQITTRVCEALAYAHKRGVIHRDIKPSNIMVDAEGGIKVSDFGLAKVVSEEPTTLTATHARMGTPDFMAPEAALNAAEVDHRADLYAVGVMLHQMLTGEIPRGRFDLPSVQRPGVDPRFDPIVDRAMQRNPAKRYSSAVEIRSDLEKIIPIPPAAGSSAPAMPIVNTGATRPLTASDGRDPESVAPTMQPVAPPAEVEAPKSASTASVPQTAPAASTAGGESPEMELAPQVESVEVVSTPPRFSAQYAREKVTPDGARARSGVAPARSKVPAYLLAVGTAVAIGLLAFFLPRLPWEKLTSTSAGQSQKAEPIPVAAQPTPTAVTGAGTPASQNAPASGFSIGGFPSGGLDPISSDRRGGNPTTDRASSPVRK